MALEKLGNFELAASLAGWLGTAFGTWLLLPAWWHIIKQKPRILPLKVVLFFASWLCGDILHLAALLMEGAGWHQTALYFIIATCEIGILLTLCFFARVFPFCCQAQSWKEDNAKATATEVGIAGFMFSVMPPQDKKPRKRVLGIIDRGLFNDLVGTAFFVACAFVVWLLVAWYRVVDLPAPEPSEMPHDAVTTVAYVFAWIGLLFWVFPRGYLIYKREDEINTTSVVLGLGAHFFNMLNIALLNFRGFESFRAQLPFFLTSVICSILDFVRLRLKKVNDKTVLHGYKEPKYKVKDAFHRARIARRNEKEQVELNDSRGERATPGQPDPLSPYRPRYHFDIDKDGVPPRSKLRPIPDAAQVVLGFGLPLTPKERIQLQFDMEHKPGQPHPKLQARAQEAIQELKEREDELGEQLDKLLDDELIWRKSKEDKEEKRKKDRELDEWWDKLCKQYGLDDTRSQRGEEEIAMERKEQLDFAEGVRQPKLGTIDYQILQTMRLVKFAFGKGDPILRKLEKDIMKRELDREFAQDSVRYRRSIRHNDRLSVFSPVALPTHRSSPSHSQARASSAHRSPSSTLLNSANHSPETPTTPSHRLHSLTHRRRRSFDSDSSFSSSNSSHSDSERSFDEEELLAGDRSSRSNGGRRCVSRR